jgi:outer membrane protein assembly factor BamB
VVAANGVVYADSGGNVYALDASTGHQLWRFTTRSYVDSFPAVANGVVYAGYYNHNVYALNASTGAKLWSYAGGFFGTDPVVANGVIYIGSGNGPVDAFGLPAGLAAPARPRPGGLP